MLAMNNLSVTGHIIDIECEIDDSFLEIEWIMRKKHVITDAATLEDVEKEIIKATDRLSGKLLAHKIQQTLDSPQLKEEVPELVKACAKNMKNQGPREVKIRPLRGEPVTVETSYYSPKEKKKGKKKRVGFYPSLELLGIHDHCSPCLASEIGTLSTVVGSFNEAQQILKDRGVELEVKTIQRVTRGFAERAKCAQRAENSSFIERVNGCKVVVSTDGGRIRIRKNKRGPKTKKGRNHYSTKWREPKLLIIYTVKANGEMDKSFAPFIDGTLKGPNAVFGLIRYYLHKLNIGKADKILFIADGARWIWNRVGELMLSLGLSSHQFYELVDFYHAVEHLGKVAALQKKWKSSERKSWVKRYRNLLLKGKVDDVIDGIKKLCRGRCSKGLRCERDYFIRNCKRMDYGSISTMGLPIGSGAMESAIRRVVNLRLKGASIYWLCETAEAMLMLRSYYKAGRWNILKNLACSVQLQGAS